MRAERVCTRSRIPCRVIPVPREISSECGIALDIDESDRAVMEKILLQEQMTARFVAKEKP